MRLLLLAGMALAIVAHASAQPAARIGQWADETQEGAAEARLDALMASEISKQIGKTITGSAAPRGYSRSEWFDTNPDQPITIGVTCDGECSGLSLRIKGPGGYGDVKGADKGNGEAVVTLAAGHPARLEAEMIVSKCDAPACAFAIGIYGATKTTRQDASTNLAAKRDPLLASMDATAIGANWQRVGGIVVRDLKDMKTHDYKLTVYPGRQTLIIGKCEPGCDQVSLSAIDEENTAIESSRLPDGSQAFQVRPDTMDFTVRATAGACPADSCRFAVGAYY